MSPKIVNIINRTKRVSFNWCITEYFIHLFICIQWPSIVRDSTKVSLLLCVRESEDVTIESEDVTIDV